MNLKPLILATIIFIIVRCYISLTTPVREPINNPTGNTNTVFRCCESRCFLLKGLNDSTIVREITYKEVYDNYDEGTIIDSRRWCE